MKSLSSSKTMRMLLVLLFVIAAASWAKQGRAITPEGMLQHIAKEFQADPRIDADRLAVRLRNRKFVVSGTVPSLGEYKLIETLLQDLVGDSYNLSKLKIAPASIDDATIENAIRTLIPLHCLVRINDFSVKSVGGRVKLMGTTGSLHHRVAAEHAVLQVRGIRSVDNLITVKTETPSDQHVREYILVLARPYVERYNVKDFRVKVKGGRVTLLGKTDSHKAKDKLEQIAAMTHGVTSVTNRIALGYPRYRDTRY